VLSAGLATRLRPLSDVRAKAALPVAGQPLVGRILRRLREAGIRRVVLNLHHRPHTITRVVGDGRDWDLNVRYSWEVPVLGSAGGPKRALPLLDAERFLIVNGDTLTDCDLRAIAHQHLETAALVTTAVIKRPVERAIVADARGVVTGFGPGDEHFIGVQAVNAEAFDDVPEGEPYETVKTLYPALLARHPGSVRVYRSGAEFLDVGTAADYLRTVDIVAHREGRDLDRGERLNVAPDARVEHSILWDDVRIGSNAQLVDCIVADGVSVPAGTRYERSVLVQRNDGLVVAPFDS
jgi:mannose-1-phosphate guanylyltransferase